MARGQISLEQGGWSWLLRQPRMVVVNKTNVPAGHSWIRPRSDEGHTKRWKSVLMNLKN